MTHLDWIESNPLRVWRRTRSLSTVQAAKLLGVDTSTLIKWEHGYRHPDGENTQEITFHTGITRQQWQEWFDGYDFETKTRRQNE